jgi:hypothetical protein
MPGSSTETSPDANATNSCSNSSSADSSVQPCAPAKKLLTVEWGQAEAFCSEKPSLSGTTQNYSNGETVTLSVKDPADGTQFSSPAPSVSGDSFSYQWDVIDVLPTGGPSWQPRRRVIAEASGVKTPEPLQVRFIPNLEKKKCDQDVTYQKQNSAGTMENFTVESRYEMDVQNFHVTIYGKIKYVKGWGKFVLKLSDATLTGGFALYSGETYHWGMKDTASGGFKYWDGTNFVATPAGWSATNTTHFGIGFYKSGSNWVCQDDTSKTWPKPLTDWPANVYTGAGNMTETTLNTWKTNIDNMWTNKFDIRRVKTECRSTKSECCRYKTRCDARFEEITSYEEHCIILVYEDTRSHASMWSMADTRAGLAPHEFGHHLGNPDEYGGQRTTQVGVSDSDGLANGVDSSSTMGSSMVTLKKRHMRGICEHLARMVKDEYGKTYVYEAVATGANLGSDPGTPTVADSHSGGPSLVGAIIGAVVGAIVGAVIGFIASGGNPAGAVAGAVAGALVGAAVGSLF